MGLFGFLKKDNSVPAKTGVGSQTATQQQAQNKQNVSTLPSTKIKDEQNSFEIPDFNEEDLNFDLGLSEFVQVKDGPDKSLKVPQSQTANIPKAKLDLSQQNKDEDKNDAFEGMVINVGELTADSKGIKKSDSKVESDKSSSIQTNQSSKKQELIPEELETEDFSNLDLDDKELTKSPKDEMPLSDLSKDSKKEKQEVASAKKDLPKKEEALPKFEVKPSLDLEKERQKNNKTFGEYLKAKSKSETPSLAEIKSQKYGLPNEVDKKGDIFIDKRKYKNMIIVSDLIKEEVETMLDIDVKLMQRIESMQELTDELSQNLDFIKENILKIDKKIFEEGEQ